MVQSGGKRSRQQADGQRCSVQLKPDPLAGQGEATIRTAFDDRVAVITGGASGIGRALCIELATRRARVVVADIDTDRATELEADLRQAGAVASVVATDVTRHESLQSLVQTVLREHGQIDLFFNNAGIAPSGPFQAVYPDQWEATRGVNLDGVVYGTMAVYPVMCAQGSGHIVNVASIAGLLPVPDLALYSATKHAVVGFSASLRAEAKRSSVRVTAVCPAFVDTRLAQTTASATAVTEAPNLAPIRGMQPARCAKRILSAVSRNRTVVSIPAIAGIAAWVYGVAPGLYHSAINPLIAWRNDRLTRS
jgi:NADP-dependent 3-hydroxy acid dehydrogenase YdfG